MDFMPVREIYSSRSGGSRLVEARYAVRARNPLYARCHVVPSAGWWPRIEAGCEKTLRTCPMRSPVPTRASSAPGTTLIRNTVNQFALLLPPFMAGSPQNNLYPAYMQIKPRAANNIARRVLQRLHRRPYRRQSDGAPAPVRARHRARAFARSPAASGCRPVRARALRRDLWSG